MAAGIVIVARLALPPTWFAYGLFSAIPFFVIGCIAAWKQMQAPSAGRIARTLEAVRAMSWTAFSQTVAEAFRREGYVVTALGRPAADFELTRVGRTALLCCKRWKTARTGVEPLRELQAEKEIRDAHDCIYITAGEITENARVFAAQRRIRLIDGADLAKLLPGVARS
ncbi:MAG: restriction endonuclease [Gammaproteobacteria bacterium]